MKNNSVEAKDKHSEVKKPLALHPSGDGFHVFYDKRVTASERYWVQQSTSNSQHQPSIKLVCCGSMRLAFLQNDVMALDDNIEVVLVTQRRKTTHAAGVVHLG